MPDCGKNRFMNPNNIRVLGYARVSTKKQKDSGLGIKAQTDALESASARLGWDLVGIVKDEAISGKNLDRPGLLELLSRVGPERIDAVAVAKLDRLTRSLVGLADLIDWGKRNNLGLIALDLGLDTSTDTGRLVGRIMASVGEWERDRISERTLAAMAVHREQDAKMGRGGVRSSNPALAARIRAERAAGMSWQKIASRLNTESVPTVRGGALWRVSAVQAAGGYLRPPAKTKRFDLPDAPRRRNIARQAAK